MTRIIQGFYELRMRSQCKLIHVYGYYGLNGRFGDGDRGRLLRGVLMLTGGNEVVVIVKIRLRVWTRVTRIASETCEQLLATRPVP